MTEALTLAYLAGAIDSDGFITIRKSTYAVRVRGDASNPVFSERIGLKQVTPQIPDLLKATFGGTVRLTKGQSENSKPLWSFNATDANASNACRLLLPLLLIKKRQAELVLELTESKKGDYKKLSYWYEQSHPTWQKERLLTSDEVRIKLGYKSLAMVSQALANGTILGLPYDKGGKTLPRFPVGLIDAVAEHARRSKDGRARVRPPELIAWRERLFEEVKALNKIGVHGTPIFQRTGHFAHK